MYTGNPGLEPNNIPAAFRSGYKKMVHVQAKSRISPEKLLTHAYFKTPLVATMYFLESLVTSTEDEKTAFFSTLLPKLDDFPMVRHMHKPKDECIYNFIAQFRSVASIKFCQFCKVYWM